MHTTLDIQNYYCLNTSFAILIVEYFDCDQILQRRKPFFSTHPRRFKGNYFLLSVLLVLVSDFCINCIYDSFQNTVTLFVSFKDSLIEYTFVEVTAYTMAADRGT